MDAQETHGVSRRQALARGAGLTALAWTTPQIVSITSPAYAVGSPMPDPGQTTAPPQTDRSLRLVSSPGPDGAVDPLVEVLVQGTWQRATAINNGLYVRFPGTGFVRAGEFCLTNSVFTFRLPFVLPAGFTSPSVTGRAQGDNDVQAVRVNGSPSLGQQPDNNSTINFDGAHPATFSTVDPAHFVAGTNYLYVDLHNNGCPLAVDIDATLTYRA